ncbi:helix-turn-helix transcriptional regulator [Nonomuraea sp. NPDC004297]
MIRWRAGRAIHAASARSWTVALLATEAGVSRAVLTRRFTALAGESPMVYLTGWRLSLAAELLCEPDAKVVSVARRVGYTNAFAFSTACSAPRWVRMTWCRRFGGCPFSCATAG